MTSLLVTSGRASFDVIPTTGEPNDVRDRILKTGLETHHGL